MYMEVCDEVRMDQGKTRIVNTGRRVRRGCCLSPILFNSYSEYSALPRKVLKGLEASKQRGKKFALCDMQMT
jgi:hypothetical protein